MNVVYLLLRYVGCNSDRGDWKLHLPHSWTSKFGFLVGTYVP